MSEIGKNLKDIVMKGIDLIGTKASELATGAKQKVDAFNLENEKKDLLAELGSKVYEMCKEGIELPEGLQTALDAVKKVEEELDALKAAGNDKTAEPADASESAAEETAPAEEAEAASEKAEAVYDDVESGESEAEAKAEAAEYAAKDDADVPVLEVEEEEDEGEKERTPLSTAIDELFENIPPVEKMAEKVNSSLDEIGESLVKLSGEFSKQLDEFASKMTGGDDDSSR